jgi:hypothetical protein
MVLLSASPLGAVQLQHGTIQGRVIDPQGAGVDGAVVSLLDSAGRTIATTTARAGRFQLTNIAPGTYAIKAEASPLQSAVQTFTVRGAHPVDVELRLTAVAAERVDVSAAQGDVGTAAVGVTLAGETVRRAPVRLRSRGLQGAVATTPGWSTEDNGLVHVRGVDDGFLYVIDGVPVYERLDGLFGVAPDPAMVDSVNVLTRYIPAEFGFKSGGVIEVRSAGRPSESWSGTVDAAVGTDSVREVSGVAGGPLSRGLALTVGAGGETSSRFLDPVHPDNLHNDGGTFSGGVQLGWQRSPSSVVNAVAGFGRSTFDVPHGEEQEDAGQDQRQRVRNHWQTVSWQRVWSAATVSQVAAYHRAGSGALAGSPNDTPLFTNADRSLARAGVLASLTHTSGRHLLKTGAEASRLRVREDFSFAVIDDQEAEHADLSEAARQFTPENPFRFHGRATGALFSAYIQDSVRVSRRLSVDLGLRADWSRLLVHASQWSPRLGVSYHMPHTRTTLRASFGRFFQPPQPENLLLASSEEARALSPFAGETGGGAALPPDRQTAIDLTLDQRLGRHARLDISYWRRRMRNVADPNVFFGTTIVFPNSVDRGEAAGVDVRVDLSGVKGWSAYASYTHARVTQYGPINGGLFLEDEIIEIGPGTAFTPDHDQRHVGGLGVTYEHERAGFWASASARYESGTPLEVGDTELDELLERPGAELVDFERGRVKPRQVLDVTVLQQLHRGRRVDFTLRLAVLNVTGARWAFNFGNPFSGTHFGPRTTLKVSLAAAFR